MALSHAKPFLLILRGGAGIGLAGKVCSWPKATIAFLRRTLMAAPGRKPDSQWGPVSEHESGVKLESPWGRQIDTTQGSGNGALFRFLHP
jgi:hypothetical protein